MRKDNALDRAVLDITPLGIKSLRNLERLSYLVRNLRGDIAEVGVYKGGSALLLCRLNPDAQIHLFDTFEGLPRITKFDNHHKKDDFSDVCEEEVRKLLSNYKNCRIYKGVFPSRTGERVEDKQFRLVHLDVDTYTRYRDSLEFFYMRLVSKGVIILDDYGSRFCLGAKKAVDEFVKENPERLILGPERQAYFFKA